MHVLSFLKWANWYLQNDRQYSDTKNLYKVKQQLKRKFIIHFFILNFYFFLNLLCFFIFYKKCTFNILPTNILNFFSIGIFLWFLNWGFHSILSWSSVGSLCTYKTPHMISYRFSKISHSFLLDLVPWY